MPSNDSRSRRWTSVSSGVDIPSGLSRCCITIKRNESNTYRRSIGYAMILSNNSYQ
jgi:hypothetical protein